MGLARMGFVALSMTAFLATGCMRDRYSSMNTAPEPLAAAPSGTVSSTALPPPAAPGVTDPSAFPQAPGGDQVAALPPQPDASAPDISAASVAGVWNASVSGQSCKVATPQTKYGAGFRAGPLRCPAPIDGVKSWNVSGKQLTLFDEGGGTLARLYSSGAEKFDGQTSTGLPISLSR